jgi:hypothetical protein
MIYTCFDILLCSCLSLLILCAPWAGKQGPRSDGRIGRIGRIGRTNRTDGSDGRTHRTDGSGGRILVCFTTEQRCRGRCSLCFLSGLRLGPTRAQRPALAFHARRASSCRQDEGKTVSLRCAHVGLLEAAWHAQHGRPAYLRQPKSA